MLTAHHDIDVSPGGVPILVHVSQYDADSREIVFNLISSSGQLTLPSGVKAEVRGTKPDGNGFSYGCTMSGNNVTVKITEQMCAAPGTVPCELVIYVGTPATEAEPASASFQQLCTATFFLKVKRAALDKDTLGSNSEIRQLVTVIDRTDALLDAASRMDEATATIVAKTREATDAAANSQQSADDAAETLRQVNQRSEETEQLVNDTLDTVDEKKQQLLRITYESDQLARQALQNSEAASNEAADANSRLDQTNDEMERVRALADAKIDGAYEENGYLYLTSNNEIVVGPLGPFSSNGSGGGGGGSSGNNAQLRLTNTSGWLSQTIAQGDPCPISLNWASEEDGIATGNGVMKVTVGGVVRANIDVTQGDVSVDVAPYLSTGTNSIRINVADVYGNNRTINFSASVVVLSITSSFDSSIPYMDVIQFPYTPTGNVAKVVHFIVDGREIGTQETSVSGRQQTFTIPAQTHGSHTFQCYFTAVINGADVRSNVLYYELICLDAESTGAVITSRFTKTQVEQYTTLNIDYTVYDPQSLSSEVEIYVNDILVSEQTVNRTQQVFSYRVTRIGPLKVEIISGGVRRTFNLTVTESEVTAVAETEDLALYLSSAGRNNNETNRAEWRYEEISAQLTGFNFASDGWVLDGDGIPGLRVAGDARVVIPYQIFETDFRSGGKTIELEFATRTVMDYDAVIFSCFSGGRGLKLTAQKVLLSSEQSEISMQFKEEEHVRVTFVVEKRTENRLIYCYINGIMSGVVQYPSDDDFSQQSPVDISIGSNDCTIDLYNIRIYDNDLTRQQILDNWIADTQTVDLLLSRYQRNQLYNEYGNIVIEQLPSNLPYLTIECAELPQYKGDKKICSGSYVNPANPAKNFTFTGAQFDVQGTSSQYYERKNYKAKFRNGFVMSNGTAESKYKLRDDSIPVSTFCFKADVASSEGANNVELVRLYNMACPYQTPAQREDARVRQGIDGFPIVIFWHNTDTRETMFIGKYKHHNFSL